MRVPVHFFIWLFLFPCDPNLHPKFSSQNSANHTFLRLLARVRLRKYRSNPILKKQGMVVILFRNQNQMLSELLNGYCYVVITAWKTNKQIYINKWGNPPKAMGLQGQHLYPHHPPFRHLALEMITTAKPVVGVTVTTSPPHLWVAATSMMNIENHLRLFPFFSLSPSRD